MEKKIGIKRGKKGEREKKRVKRVLPRGGENDRFVLNLNGSTISL